MPKLITDESQRKRQTALTLTNGQHATLTSIGNGNASRALRVLLDSLSLKDMEGLRDVVVAQDIETKRRKRRMAYVLMGYSAEEAAEMTAAKEAKDPPAPTSAFD